MNLRGDCSGGSGGCCGRRGGVHGLLRCEGVEDGKLGAGEGWERETRARRTTRQHIRITQSVLCAGTLLQCCVMRSPCTAVLHCALLLFACVVCGVGSDLM